MSDYSDIQAELDDFKNAVYGEEVRDSMISAIKKIHDRAESAAGAPDASSATAGQAPIADGAGGWAWGDVATSGDSVPTEVRQALLALFQNGVYTRDDMSDEVAVIQSWATEVTAITLNRTTLNINGMNQQTLIATTTPAGGVVTWSCSDTTICTVSGGVVTPTGINGSCTITASCGGKSASCAVTVSGFATLLSIEAVYTQSGTVYNTDALDSLKSDLVVTGTYDDSRTLPITDYVLSGTLTVGTSVITVSYGGKTTTFNVTVTDPDQSLYSFDTGTAQWNTKNYDGTNQDYLTVTNGNHIEITRLSSAEFAVSNMSKYNTGAVLNGAGGLGMQNQSEWFTIPSGATCDFYIKDGVVEGTAIGTTTGSIALYEPNSSNWKGERIANTSITWAKFTTGEHVTFTVSEDTPVAYVGCSSYVNDSGKVAGTVVLMVNGARWI